MGPFPVPQIPPAQLAAIVFTSGSTGTPLPYKKTWGRLARCVRDGAARLGLLDGRSHTLIGTVPPQHMYGFESTVLLALLSGNAFTAERPFYPADICAAIAAAPRPRALVSTPIHLRALLAAGIDLPPLDLIVSATAPLDRISRARRKADLTPACSRFTVPPKPVRSQRAAQPKPRSGACGRTCASAPRTARCMRMAGTWSK